MAKTIASDPDCAWCNKEAGRPQGEISHTVCEEHSEQIYQQYRAEKQQKESEAADD